MDFEELQTKLNILEKGKQEALETCNNNEERKITSTAIDIKKMEFLNDYLVENCYDENLLSAIEQFSDLAKMAVSELVKRYNSS